MAKQLREAARALGAPSTLQAARQGWRENQFVAARGPQEEMSRKRSAGTTRPQQTHAATGMASFALCMGALGRLRGRQASKTVP